MRHEEFRAEFSDDVSCIVGTAVYHIETERHLSRDVGGIDGDTATATLVGIRCGAGMIPRAALVECYGARIEEDERLWSEYFTRNMEAVA